MDTIRTENDAFRRIKSMHPCYNILAKIFTTITCEKSHWHMRSDSTRGNEYHVQQ